MLVRRLLSKLLFTTLLAVALATNVFAFSDNENMPDSNNYYQTIITQNKASNAMQQFTNNIAYAKFLEKAEQLPHALIAAQQALAIAQKNSFEKETGTAFLLVGSLQTELSNYTQAEKSINAALAIFLKINDTELVVKAYNSLGVVFDFKSNYPQAAKYYFKSLQEAKKLNKPDVEAGMLKNIGTVLHLQSKDAEAIKYLQQARSIFVTQKSYTKIAGCDNDIANIYADAGNYNKAEELYSKALAVYTADANLDGMVMLNSNLAELQIDMKNYKKSIEYCNQALFFAKKIDDVENLIQTHIILSKNYFQLGNYAVSLAHIDTAETLNKNIDGLSHLPEIYEYKFKLLEHENNFEKALYYHKLFKQVNDSIFNSSNSREVSVMKENFEQAQLEKNREIKEKENRWTLYFLAAGMFFMLVIAFVLMRLNRTKRQANISLTAQNIKVEEQKKIIEIKNKEITDSIVYAQTIQNAILPTVKDFTKVFPKSFICYKPKDIVSGDFYWLHTNDEYIVYATADCTGHGVPGGFMSMLSASLLNEIIIDNQNFEPASILNLLREKIIYSLKQNSFDSQNKDGLDMVICVIKKEILQLTYAGANNGFYIFNTEGNMREYYADRQPIGVSGTTLKPFTQQKIDLQKGNRIYTFTDGYIDQFGGEKGKKLKYKNFESLLQSVQTISIANQGIELANFFDKWKGTLEQVDDVTVIGVEV